VEVRVFDTPLTTERAAALAAYVQSIARYALTERPHDPSREVYMLYNYNRFQACRYGLEGTIIDAYTRNHVRLREDVLETLQLVAPHAAELGAAAVLEELAAGVRSGRGDAAWLRRTYRECGSLNDVARMQSDLWMGRATVPA
jgi:carboxylate-amine ligase